MSNAEHPRDVTRTLSQHLTSYATAIEPTPDPDGLRARIQRVDRNRRIRNAGAAGSLVAVVAFGAFSLGGGESASQLDVRGEAPVESPTGPGPDLGPAGSEVSDDGSRDEAGQQPASIGGDGIAPSDPPAHLQTAPPTTTVQPAAPVSTTTPPVTAPVAQPTTTTSPPATTVPPTTSGPVSFSAVAKYGSCEEDPPYDEYSGTATPGATITITSPWSSTAQVVADSNGQWWIRVEFPDAPVDTPFDVSVSDGADSTAISFVRLA